MINNKINIASFRALDSLQRAKNLREINRGLLDGWMQLEVDYKIVDITDKEIALCSAYGSNDEGIEIRRFPKDLITEIDPQELKTGQFFKGVEYSDTETGYKIGEIQFVEFIEEPKPMSEEEVKEFLDSLPASKGSPTPIRPWN